ncbi:conserved hypothetical protein [Vibrio nigripulchritudo MADA3029]|uniref:hypothetical protein n=1 Tax=Vibrio nigripulchritudo TaxID=28173 RepID=UPI0003B19C0E|nr:hypothetical protein [Vibrio nigripulchritudo]CCN47650.1 conserved hypothetical protein [Vibrio nigripulchritudo MADA3020]CCN56528.1 conserved hypothetical protein [Vibrio nigripulchritudo MADA3021]CCN58849.1 conserved hypothetical protein [Vibrio nigripulchritudo MADA3029]
MKIISHRRNTLEELSATPFKYGVEVDIRSNSNNLVIHHDPMSGGVDFEVWLKAYSHSTLILNVKEEGLEKYILPLMESHGIKDFFFLDQSFPFLVKWSGYGEKRCAVRVSEYESVDTALSLKEKVEWVWVDCFTELSLTKKDSDKLKDAGFKLCLVSPELQGRDADIEIPKMHRLINQRNLSFDAVCTKHPDIWDALNEK